MKLRIFWFSKKEREERSRHELSGHLGVLEIRWY